MTSETGFLKVSCIWNSFLLYLWQDLSWGQLPFTAPQAFWIGGARQPRWASCSYRKCPQGSSISSCPTLIPPATWALGKVGLLGCELGWNGYTQGLLPLDSFPHETSPLPPLQPGALLSDEVPRRLHSQEGVLSWGPQHQETWGLGDFPCSSL